MSDFAIDYYLFIFVATLGAMQLASLMGRVKGLLIFKSPIVGWAFGLGLIMGAFIWFFVTDNRNLNDYEGGLDANQQAFFFSMGVLTGVLVTVVFSSIVNFKMNGCSTARNGLEALRHAHYAGALSHSLRCWVKEWWI